MTERRKHLAALGLGIITGLFIAFGLWAAVSIAEAKPKRPTLSNVQLSEKYRALVRDHDDLSRSCAAFTKSTNTSVRALIQSVRKLQGDTE